MNLDIVSSKEKSMKLRDDITVKEYAEVMKDRGYTAHPFISELSGGPETTSVPMDWPDSFYEQPPVGSFGKFVSDSYYERWGHLQSINNGLYVCAENESGYQHFTPGLPTDVTADGMPEESEQ